MQTFTTYRDYFSNIQADPLFSLNTFGYGDSTRIIETMKSDIAYPVLWAERPDYYYEEMGDNILKYCNGAFCILKGFPKDEYEDQEAFHTQAQTTAEAIIKKMRTDGYIKKGDRLNMEPLETQMTDNCWGVRVTFTTKNMEGNFLCNS